MMKQPHEFNIFDFKATLHFENQDSCWKILLFQTGVSFSSALVLIHKYIIMSTHNETKNSLIFFSAKDFLEAVGISFEFRFTKITNGDKFLLQFRPIGSEGWEQKSINICLRHHNVVSQERHYSLAPLPDALPELVDDEAKYLLDLRDYINQRLLKATLGPRQPIEKSIDNLVDLVIYGPYKFTPNKLEGIQALPGVFTLRIGNGWILDHEDHTYHYGFFLQFNTWKYLQPSSRKQKREIVLPLETPTKLLKRVPETEVPTQDAENSKPVDV